MFGLVSEKRYKELEKDCLDLRERILNNKNNGIENQRLKLKLNKLENEITSLKKQIREQAEADLFFISAKIQKKLLDGEPKENIQDMVAQQTVYQQALAQQQNPYSNFLQGLGLGNILPWVR